MELLLESIKQLLNVNQFEYQTSLASTLLTDKDEGPKIQIKITKHISVIIKKKLLIVRNQKKMRPVLSEEEMDNLANKALEEVLHCIEVNKEEAHRKMETETKRTLKNERKLKYYVVINRTTMKEMFSGKTVGYPVVQDVPIKEPDWTEFLRKFLGIESPK